MTILICIPCLLTGGTEIQTLNLVHALAGAGNRVVTVCYFEHSSPMVARFEQAGSTVVCLSNDGSRVMGWRVLPFLYKGLRKVLKQYKPDVVHVQYMAPGAIPILLLRLMGFRQIIATAHTAADIYPNLRLVHFIQRRCVRAFTCITELAERSFFGSSQLYNEDTKLKKRNHFTIYNALPADIAVASQPKAHDGPLTIGVVSRLERIKGMDLVIPAFAKVYKQHPQLRLLVVGDGSLRREMEQQVHKAGLEDAVEFAGRQPQDALVACYDRIDILLMPSRSEGFGLTAIEGMARGCVVVAARTGGLPEVVQEGVVGLLHTPESVDDLAAQIDALVQQPQRWKAYSTEAVGYVQRFSLPRYSELFNDVYRKIIS